MGPALADPTANVDWAVALLKSGHIEPALQLLRMVLERRTRALGERDRSTAEVRGLLAAGIPPSAKPFEAIGYRHVTASLDSGIDWEDTIRIIQRDTRRYAKRQMTWFRKQPGVTWFDGPGDIEEIKNRVHQHLKPLVNF